MQTPRPGRSILDRALLTSWIVAIVIAAVLAPSHPYDALSLLAGQLIAFLHFMFLRKIVKIFTEKRKGAGRFILTKLVLVYGGLMALIGWGKAGYAPLCAGFALPFLTLFLKSMMLAFGAGPASLTRRGTPVHRAGAGAGAGGAAALALILLALAAASPARAEEPLPTANGAHGTVTGQASHPQPVTHAAEAQHEEGAAELPNWLVILHDWNPGNPVIDWLDKNQIIVFAWIAGLLFLFISWLAMRNAKMVPGVLQNAVEWMVESMESIAGGLLGEKHIQRHFPIIGALFFYILTINMLGIIPGMKSATSSLDLTLALALITFLYVQFWGIRNLGIIGYLDHLAGSPRDAIGWAMLPVMLPVHVLGELAKPVSLSCRLFGNIFGEDTLIVVFVGATAVLIKALIFSLLATVYLYMMLPHEEHGHEESNAEAHATL
ncbi:MAG: F0F1 ATP synthase subunit A [Candidatus Eisenbacteria bacterium]|uniref:ATP synthase subunit a n=1 Tax=Eiseniibacteriota bacterium TaxID=2212470 RepID=A0A538T121_UNCEI|nr:MAG: F0F1 ATP synthase subunit A [Candidatus Eisenbacteria bacterium]